MRHLIVAGSAAGLLLFASAAGAVEAKKSIDVAATPDKVWAAIGDFCGIGQWHPAVEKCEPSQQEGANMRTLSLKGGGTILEREVKRDDAAMSYTYQIVESPLPVQNYESTIVVTPKDANSSTITWSSNFEAKGATDDEARGVIEGIYQGGLDSLNSKF